MPRTPMQSRRRSRTSCSVIALATVMAVGATPAAAQSLLGTGTYVTNPNVTGITTTPGPGATTTVNLNGGQTVIDWTPTDNATGTGTNINFQNSGTTALFTGATDFAVLNRVLPADISRAIIMNGTVNSEVGGSQGGSVYFYSPSGFIFGGSSVFNVGSLVVTASPITLTGDNFINGPDNTVVFGQALNPNAAISSGGTINANPALPGQSYVAMVAPRVAHSGSITVNGSAALVGAEAATINFSPDGLFDIQVTVGTNSSSGINVSGDIGGPAPTSATDRQGVYLVAVPKNDALTMVISNGADLGFTLANDASIDAAGAVVLSAGHDIVDGAIGAKSAAPGLGLADFWFTGAHATNNLFGEATGSAYLYSVTGPNLTTIFDSDVTVHARNNLWMNAAGATTSLSVGGNLDLSTDVLSGVEGGSVIAGQTHLYALDGASVTVAGNVDLSANGNGSGSSTIGIPGGAGTGGHVLIQAAGGNITIGGNTIATANGQGGSGFGDDGGIGQGGFVEMTASNATLTFNGSVSAYAEGYGGVASFTGDAAGLGEGGRVLVQAQGAGTLNLTQGLYANASGQGGSSIGDNVIVGNGIGGDIDLWATGTNATLTSSGNVTLVADGYSGGIGGDCFACGGVGGNGIGGEVFVNASSNAALTVVGSLNAYADGYGGSGIGADGGNGTGGWVQFAAYDGGSLSVEDSLFGTASGFGGDSGNGYGGDFETMFAGDGIGGIAEMLTSGSGAPAIDIDGSAWISANGRGGDVFTFFGQFDVFDVQAQSGGGFPTAADANIRGGDGTGGRAGIYSNAGEITINSSANVEASGRGGIGFGGTGGDGRGRLAEVSANGGDITIAGSVDVSADGEGGYGDFGGDGYGGGDFEANTDGAHLFAMNGTITLGGSADVSADGYGGDSNGGFFFYGGTGGDGGDGYGGWAMVHAGNSNLGPSVISVADVESSLNISAGGYGGQGDSGTDGINGIDGLGGEGGSIGGPGQPGTDGTDGGAGGDGGSGTGGDVRVTAAAGNGTLTITEVNATAFGEGGNGGTGGFGGHGGWGGAGGNGDGGAGGDGGAAGNGGDAGIGGTGGLGTGGSVTIGTQNGINQATGSNLGVATFGNVYADASATGGRGGDGGGAGSGGLGGAGGSGDPGGLAGANGADGADANGGNGGDAAGGAAILLARGSTVTVTGSANLVADANGGDGGNAYFYGGGSDGAGGDATVGGVGGIGVIATERSGFVGQRGTINAGAITGTAIATGGSGSETGATQTLGRNLVVFRNADGNIESLDFTVAADGMGLGAFEDAISVVNGTLAVSDSFSFVTDGTLSLLVDTGSLTAPDLTLSAADFVPDTVTLNPVNPGTIFADNVSITTGNNFIARGNWDVTNTFIVDAPGLIDVDNIHDDNGIDFSAGGSISISGLDAGTYVDLFAGGSIDTGNITAGSSVDETSTGGSIGAGNITAGGSVTLIADTFIAGEDISSSFGSIFAQTNSGDIALENLTSTFGTITLDAGDDIFLSGDLLADGDIELTADGNIFMNNAQSHQSIDITGGGYVDGLDLTAGDSVEIEAAGFVDVGNLSAGLVNPSFNVDADYVAAIHAGGNIATGNIEAAQHVGLATPGTITTGDIDAGGIFMALGTGNMSFGDATAGDEIYLADYSMMALGGEITDEFDPLPILAAVPTRTGGSILIGNVSASKFTAAAGTSLTTGIINSDSGIGLGAGGAILTGNLFAGDFVLANGGSITTGNIDADSVDMTSTGGNISTGGIFAFGAVSLDAFGDIFAGDIQAESIDLLAGDDINTGDLSTLQLFLLAQESGGFTTFLFPGASITLEAGDDINTGNIESIDGVYANAGGSITTGNIDANSFVELYSVDFTDTGAIDAGSHILVDAGGYIDTGNLTAGTDIELLGGDSIDFGDADAGITFDFEAGGSVNGGNIVAGLTIEGEADGSVTLGNLTAGFESNEAIDDDTFSVGIQATGPIDVGNVQGVNRVGFATLGDLDTGSIQTGWDFFAYSDGDIATGSITTGAGDQVYMSGTAAFFAAGGGEDSDFDPDAALGIDPSASGGSITINGPVTTGAIRAAAGQNFTANAITAPGINSEGDFLDGIQVWAGGTAAINGIWNSGDTGTYVTSNDINITATGGIDAGWAILNSTNATQTVVGDGVGGGGYQLSDAEYERIHVTEELEVHADASSGAAPLMFLGDLSVAVPNAEGESEGIEYEFATSDGESEDTGTGRIRIVGDVTFTGTGMESVSFTTGTFELDAANGLLALTSNGTDLAGFLDIEAPHIHIASAAILDQLAVNPTYTGYQQDLNDPAAVQRPEGVIRAATIQLDLEGDDVATVFVQNTGTSEVPAGFLVTDEIFVGEDGESEMPSGSINLIINGQIQTEGGTLTGIDVRDAMVADQGDLTPFTDNSTINGCPLTGPCVAQEQPPRPPSVVDDQIDLIGFDPLGDSDFGNEFDIDDNLEGDDGGGSPITPPQPLFDTRPLVPSSDVNDPVSGTGNPSLMGGDDCKKDDDSQCATEKEDGQ